MKERKTEGPCPCPLTEGSRRDDIDTAVTVSGLLPWRSLVARPNEYVRWAPARRTAVHRRSWGHPRVAGAVISRAGGVWAGRGRPAGRDARSEEQRVALPDAAQRTRRQPAAPAPGVARYRSGAWRCTPSSTPRRARSGVAHSAARCARPVRTAHGPRQRARPPKRRAEPGRAARTPRLPPAIAGGRARRLDPFGGWSESSRLELQRTAGIRQEPVECWDSGTGGPLRMIHGASLTPNRASA